MFVEKNLKLSIVFSLNFYSNNVGCLIKLRINPMNLSGNSEREIRGINKFNKPNSFDNNNISY